MHRRVFVQCVSPNSCLLSSGLRARCSLNSGAAILWLCVLVYDLSDLLDCCEGAGLFDPGTEADLADARVPRLSDEQLAVFEAAMSAVMAPAAKPRGNGFYVDGPGGSGKTFLYEALIHTV